MEAKGYNEELRAALEAYRESATPPMTLGELARELGSNSTQVSKYLNSKPEGDVAAMEAIIADVLKNAKRRKTLLDLPLFVTPVSRRLAGACEQIRKTNDVGLIHSAAGLGKTCAIQLYLANNPSAVGITIARWSGSANGIERALFGAIETRGWKGNTPRAEYLLGRFSRSNRLLITDNAHRVTASGLQWLFDFHDATGCPIALVGNPEVLAAIKLNDQQFSRIGLLQEIKLSQAEAMARTMLEQHNAPADLLDLAVAVLSRRGHLRALRKHLILMPDMLDGAGGNHRKAFLAAHTCLVSDYPLS